MTALFLSNDIEARIQEVVKFAVRPENRRTVKNLFSPGDNPNYMIDIPFGFKSVFSVDEVDGGKWIKHLSVSVSATHGKTSPNEPAMRMIAKAFGFSEKASYGTMPSDPPNVVHVMEDLE